MRRSTVRSIATAALRSVSVIVALVMKHVSGALSKTLSTRLLATYHDDPDGPRKTRLRPLGVAVAWAAWPSPMARAASESGDKARAAPESGDKARAAPESGDKARAAPGNGDEARMARSWGPRAAVGVSQGPSGPLSGKQGPERPIEREAGGLP